MWAVNTLLEQSPEIKLIIDKLQQLQQLNRYLANFLPDYLAKHCVVANLRGGVLVLVTDGPVWKNQLSLLRMDLLEKLRSNPNWAGISSISITIDYLIADLNQYVAELSGPVSILAANSNNSNQVDIAENNTNNNNTNNYNFTISQQTAKLVKNIANQDIKHQPLLQKLTNLINKITR
jgi:hypothetical protein